VQDFYPLYGPHREFGRLRNDGIDGLITTGSTTPHFSWSQFNLSLDSKTSKIIHRIDFLAWYATSAN